MLAVTVVALPHAKLAERAAAMSAAMLAGTLAAGRTAALAPVDLFGCTIHGQRAQVTAPAVKLPVAAGRRLAADSPIHAVVPHP